MVFYDSEPVAERIGEAKPVAPSHAAARVLEMSRPMRLAEALDGRVDRVVADSDQCRGYVPPSDCDQGGPGGGGGNCDDSESRASAGV